jgi:hypothetical protein
MCADMRHDLSFAKVFVEYEISNLSSLLAVLQNSVRPAGGRLGGGWFFGLENNQGWDTGYEALSGGAQSTGWLPSRAFN